MIQFETPHLKIRPFIEEDHETIHAILGTGFDDGSLARDPAAPVDRKSWLQVVELLISNNFNQKWVGCGVLPRILPI
jgi:hypothetical protein